MLSIAADEMMPHSNLIVRWITGDARWTHHVHVIELT
jgi:hypothetical protein